MKIKFDVRKDGNGKDVLYFPFMSLSDIHLGTKYSRAKKLCHMLERTMCDRTALVGDIVDGTALLKKKTWNWGPWHRQAMAHILRKTAAGMRTDEIDGNHEDGMRGDRMVRDGVMASHRDLAGKSIFGIGFHHHMDYVDPRGRRFLVIHGDQYDAHVFGRSRYRKAWYAVGDFCYTRLYDIDSLITNIPLMEHFSLAASGKRLTKTIINKLMGVHEAMGKVVDRSGYDGILSGHSHMAGFERTPGGKLLFNDGCCTEHVQAMVHDRDGNWAVIEWHRDRIDVYEEDGNRASLYWKDLGIEDPSFAEPPEPVEDCHTDRADRLLRLIYRMWPPKERRALRADIVRQRHIVAQYAEAVRAGGHDGLYRAVKQALAEKESRFVQIPIPRRKEGQPAVGIMLCA